MVASWRGRLEARRESPQMLLNGYANRVRKCRLQASGSDVVGKSQFTGPGHSSQAWQEWGPNLSRAAAATMSWVLVNLSLPGPFCTSLSRLQAGNRQSARHLDNFNSR